MDDLILSVNTLPYPLHRRIHSDKVRIHEENGIIMLMPISELHPVGAGDTASEATIRPVFGSGKGQMWIADDFDAPLEEMMEYME